MKKCLQNIVKYREQDSLIKEIICGFHIEGPFISKEVGYRGAHPEEHILEADINKMESLLESAGELTKIVTIAPEVDPNNELTRFLINKGITVSAGHCNPSKDELKSAIDAGLSMFTHLGNGCPQEIPRHDNIIQRALSFKDDLQICFIADGIHIPFFALKNYIAAADIENVVITTDAMAAAGAKEGRYTLSNIELEVGEDRIVRKPGKPNFAGSAIDMKSSYKNLIKEIGLTIEEAKKMTSSNPFKVFSK